MGECILVYTGITAPKRFCASVGRPRLRVVVVVVVVQGVVAPVGAGGHAVVVGVVDARGGAWRGRAWRVTATSCRCRSSSCA